MGFKSYSKNSKNALIVFFMILLATAADGFACQVMVNDNYQKNTLVSLAASELDLSLSGMKSISLSNYSRTLEGSNQFECPEHLITSAKVSFQYSPKLGQNCTASVTILHDEYMGELTPDFQGPLYEVTPSSPDIACSTSSGRLIKVPKFPQVVKRPIVIKPVR